MTSNETIKPIRINKPEDKYPEYFISFSKFILKKKPYAINNNVGLD
jgi:hypothetical protein